jgi:nucleotide-binding universal stress UspA family protein
MLERVLVPLDTSEAAERLLPYVTILAKGLQQPIVLLTVIPDLGELNPVASIHDAALQELTERRRKYAQDYLDRTRARLESDGLAVTTVVAVGRIAETIVATAEAQGAGLIAMATHGRVGPERWFLGSVATKVVHDSSTPVLLIRPHEEADVTPPSVQHILLPLDGSPLAETAIPYATLLAKTFNAPVTAIRALPLDMLTTWDPYAGEPDLTPEMQQILEDEVKRYLDDVAARMRAEGVDAKTEFVTFSPAAADIVDLAEQTPGALVVMTTHGRSGLGRALLGSVTDRVVRSSAAPVLVVRAVAEVPQ